ncbi:MAG TPA: hypothetical protein VK335_04310 [Bryobacteraceae bacterium]|nr:hypothetical protein [Bryobacteraceae bacterium]
MKKTMLLTVGISCLLVGMAAPVSAQILGVAGLKSDVPFAFVSGGRTIQAGQYVLQIKQGLVRFLDEDGHAVHAIVSNTQDCNHKEEQPRLVFHRYGETYFLWQVWSRDYKVEFGTSRTEHKLKAGLKADQETVILAMR